MLNFDERTGPESGAAASAYPEPGIPAWYEDAKLGFFIHLGLYSVPAWATTASGPVPVEEEYTYHRYAEWYGNTVRIEGSPTQRRHQELYGLGTSYEDLADAWDARAFNAEELISRIVDAGARYVIPTTKHHDGFCLWDTATTGFNSVRRGPQRDFIQELHDATRAAGVRFGTYFSGALDWHVSDFPPIQSDRELFLFRRNDEAFARYSTAQLEELIERFAPDVLWNDIEWPDGGKGEADFGLAAVFQRYLQRVPEGAINDRWGIPYHGYSTREYRNIDQKLDYPWESTRGLGFSFGYNQAEGPEHTLSGAQLIRLLVDVVSKNGNLLINIGPRADGSIPDLQAASMAELGRWLRAHGEAIYGTRPWVRFGDGDVRYTTREGRVYALLDPALGELPVPQELAGARLRWLGADGEVTVEAGDRVAVPHMVRGEPVVVAVLEGISTAGA